MGILDVKGILNKLKPKKEVPLTEEETKKLEERAEKADVMLKLEERQEQAKKKIDNFNNRIPSLGSNLFKGVGKALEKAVKAGGEMADNLEKEQGGKKKNGK